MAQVGLAMRETPLPRCLSPFFRQPPENWDRPRAASRTACSPTESGSTSTASSSVMLSGIGKQFRRARRCIRPPRRALRRGCLEIAGCGTCFDGPRDTGRTGRTRWPDRPPRDRPAARWSTRAAHLGDRAGALVTQRGWIGEHLFSNPAVADSNGHPTRRRPPARPAAARHAANPTSVRQVGDFELSETDESGGFHANWGNKKPRSPIALPLHYLQVCRYNNASSNAAAKRQSGPGANAVAAPKTSYSLPKIRLAGSVAMPIAALYQP